MSDTWIVENKWPCSTCGTVNRGRDMRCDKCGSPKEDDEEYDLSGSTTAPKVTDREQLKVARGGANWKCSYCGSDARNIHDECRYCGGPKTEAATGRKPNTVTVTRKKGSTVEQSFQVDAAAKQITEIFEKAPKAAENFFFPEEKISKKLAWFNKQNKTTLGIILGVTIVIGFFYWLFAWHNQHVTVKTTHWTRTTEIEQRSTHHGEGWDDDRPLSHFNDECETRQHGTHDCNAYQCRPHQVSYSCGCHQVPSGTSCTSNGNGYSTCRTTYSTQCNTCYRTEYDTCYHQCPTYDQWCEYDFYRWDVVRAQTNGGIDHNQSYPVIAHHDNAIGPQRVLHSETYSVTFCTEDDSWSYSPSNSQDYDRFVRGHHWLIETNHAGQVKPIQNEHH